MGKLHLPVAVVAALAILASGLSAPVAAAAGPSLEHWGFYVTYDPASRVSLTENLNALDAVVPAYFRVAADGTITGADDATVDTLVLASGKRLLPLVQNEPRSAALAPILDTPTLRAQVIRRLVELAVDHQYDGLTLDFEGVAPADRTGLTAFSQTLAAALHARGKLLAVAVPARSGELSNGWSRAFDYAAIGTAADRIIVMAYGFRTAASTQPGSFEPLDWVQQVSDYALSRVPADRLVLGIGVWGYDWNISRGGPARALSYAQTADLIRRNGGPVRFDPSEGTPSYRYQVDGQTHDVWFENADSLRAKITLAMQDRFAGVAFWRLGQEPPGLWGSLDRSRAADFAIPNGWFFTETAAGTGLGYRVTDNDGVLFWSEFRRLGGVATLGYPSSRRFVGADGFTYQVFQRGVLQWRPERHRAFLTNTFEQLSAAGWDERLAQLGIPSPIRDDGSNGNWSRAREIRLAWLTNPAIAAAFAANPNPAAIRSWDSDRSIELYGLPASLPVKSGPFIVQRFQRISLQLWVENVAGMPPKGSVVGILGGDLFKQAGLVPPEAQAPELP